MEFKSVSIIKQPTSVVADTLIHRLPDLVPFLEDVEEITQSAQSVQSDGSVNLVHEWHASVDRFSFLPSEKIPERLSWTEKTTWNPARDVCAWSVDLHWPEGLITCRGETRLASAIAGKATRVTFSGTSLINQHARNQAPGWMMRVVDLGIESVLTSIFASNFRKLASGVEHLWAEAQGPAD